jgi:ParB family chromosome partitioning protein
MARKDLLKGLMDASHAPADSEESRVDTGRPRYTGGAIGAVSQSIAGLKSRSVHEIDPMLVDTGGVRDRLDADEVGHQALVESIRDHGQQVPVLLRPHPDHKGRYQVVYGRRRVLALRDLGQPVKALIRDLDDRGLLLAQGQENAARRDLSFIEKANFARQMRDQGYERATICAALHVDKTVVSRMLSVVDRLPVDLIEVIGAAPSVGRDRWLVVAEGIEAGILSAEEAQALANLAADAGTSDKRFEAVFAALQQSTPPPRRRPARQLEGASGAAIGEVTEKSGATVLALSEKASPGFAEWLIARLPEIHRRWQDGGGD